MDAELNCGLSKESDFHLLGREAPMTSEQDVELGPFKRRMGKIGWPDQRERWKCSCIVQSGQSLVVLVYSGQKGKRPWSIDFQWSLNIDQSFHWLNIGPALTVLDDQVT